MLGRLEAERSPREQVFLQPELSSVCEEHYFFSPSPIAQCCFQDRRTHLPRERFGSPFALRRHPQSKETGLKRMFWSFGGDQSFCVTRNQTLLSPCNSAFAPRHSQIYEVPEWELSRKRPGLQPIGANKTTRRS